MGWLEASAAYTQSQSDLQTSMSNNLRAFIVANFIQAACWIINDIPDKDLICETSNQPGDITNNGRCQQIALNGTCNGQIISFLDTDTIQNQQSFNTNPVYGTVRPEVVIQNAVGLPDLFFFPLWNNFHCQLVHAIVCLIFVRLDSLVPIPASFL
jgi:hypothetical protein